MSALALRIGFCVGCSLFAGVGELDHVRYRLHRELHVAFASR